MEKNILISKDDTFNNINLFIKEKDYSIKYLMLIILLIHYHYQNQLLNTKNIFIFYFYCTFQMQKILFKKKIFIYLFIFEKYVCKTKQKTYVLSFFQPTFVHIYKNEKWEEKYIKTKKKVGIFKK